MKIRIHRLIPVTEAEGPGKRFALWTQGCPIRCPGCFNPQTWSNEGGQVLDVDALFARVSTISGIEGVSLLGGEPFAQALPLAAFAERCRGIGPFGRNVHRLRLYACRELEPVGLECASLGHGYAPGRPLRPKRARSFTTLDWKSKPAIYFPHRPVPRPPARIKRASQPH